ncbi:MAG: hypothetical protein NG712_02850 [Omnitrophica bacterium]|nr:hypothetical protein [Candidatus Omnitrophota bacterium]
MNAYAYNPITKEYVGRVKMQPNPLEGGFLLPANSTLDKPPYAKKKQIAVWNDKWEIKKDNRGTYWSKKTKEEQEITEIGLVKDKNWTKLQPISGRCIWDVDQWVEPPLTIEEQEIKDKTDYSETMPDLVKSLEARIALLETRGK